MPTTKQLWATAFSDKLYKQKFLLVLFVLISILIFLPFFFAFIEKRSGTVLSDFVLNNLPAKDVSLYIFCIIWAVTLIMVITAIKNPSIFLLVLCAFTLVTISRIVSIYFVALNPPVGLIILKDPLSNFFYGNTFITKDLFYSGHTATMFLFFLCLQNPISKFIAFFATLLVGFFVLLQHVHYTLDVVAAPFFVYIIYQLSKYYTSKVKF